MSTRGGRPRTFPPAAVEIAVERREKTGEPWVEIAKDLRVNPGTLRARASEFRRALDAHKTTVGPLSLLGGEGTCRREGGT